MNAHYEPHYMAGMCDAIEDQLELELARSSRGGSKTCVVKWWKSSSIYRLGGKVRAATKGGKSSLEASAMGGGVPLPLQVGSPPHKERRAAPPLGPSCPKFPSTYWTLLGPLILN